MTRRSLSPLPPVPPPVPSGERCPSCGSVMNVLVSELARGQPAGAEGMSVCAVCGDLLVCLASGLHPAGPAERAVLLAHPDAGPAVETFLARLLAAVERR